MANLNRILAIVINRMITCSKGLLNYLAFLFLTMRVHYEGYCTHVLKIIYFAMTCIYYIGLLFMYEIFIIIDMILSKYNFTKNNYYSSCKKLSL